MSDRGGLEEWMGQGREIQWPKKEKIGKDGERYRINMGGKQSNGSIIVGKIGKWMG